MFQIEYPKPLRLAAAGALALKILYQLFCVVFFHEALPLWAILLLLMEGFAIFAMCRGERDFVTVLPFLGIAILENILFFSSDGAMLSTTSFHLVTTIVIAILFIFSMVGRMYEHRHKLIFMLALLVAAWGYDLFLAIFNSPELGPLDLLDVRILLLDPVAYGLCAAWASFPRMVHNLTEEEVEAQILANENLVKTGKMSIYEYNEEAALLMKGLRKKK